MRLERMVIGNDGDALTLAIHPRLTVIAGAGSVERQAVVGELVGALGPNSSDVQLEVTEDSGRRLTIVRPKDGHQRVVDSDTSADLTHEFRSGQDRVDLLAAHGLDTRTARAAMRLDRTGLQEGARNAHMIRRLAAVDQTHLWATATRLRISEDERRQASEETSHVDDVVATAAPGADGAEPDRGRGRLARRIRWAAIGVGLCAVGGLIAVIDPIRTAPLLACVLLAIVLVLFYRAKLLQRPATERPDTAANARANLRLTHMADNRRVCDQRWIDVAGDINVTWALEHHEEIVAASAALDESSTDRSDIGNGTADLAREIEARLAALHHLGELGESFPLILDEPFAGLDEGVTTALLELVGRRAGNPQVLILTEDDQVASWGRLEALTGRLAVIEETVDEPAAPGLGAAPRA